MLLARCPFLIRNLAASSLPAPVLPLLLPLLPKVGALGSAKALLRTGVTSPSWAHPIPGLPPTLHPWLPLRICHSLGGGGGHPLGQTPEGPQPEAQRTQTALSAPSWRLFCLAAMISVPETKPDGSKRALSLLQLGGPGRDKSLWASSLNKDDN